MYIRIIDMVLEVTDRRPVECIYCSSIVPYTVDMKLIPLPKNINQEEES